MTVIRGPRSSSFKRTKLGGKSCGWTGTLQKSKTLQDKCAALKEEVKQAIEILEGHGKVIRVFTIVTLFFLPLSFVSTFSGMDTTDVDGFQWEQNIF